MPLWSRRNILYSSVWFWYHIYRYICTQKPDESPCICYHHDRLSFLCGDWLFSAQCIHQNKVKLYMYNGKGRFSTFTQDFKNVFSKNILVFFSSKNHRRLKSIFFLFIQNFKIQNWSTLMFNCTYCSAYVLLFCIFRDCFKKETLLKHKYSTIELHCLKIIWISA